VVEIDRPNRPRRRRTGKSDPEDAVAAARAAQGGDATGLAKSRDGNVESMRVLRVARSSARRRWTQAINQMRSLISTAPDELRAELREPLFDERREYGVDANAGPCFVQWRRSSDVATKSVHTLPSKAV
jgi:hypothetical protein